MNEKEIENLIAMFKGEEDDIRLAQQILRNVTFYGKNKYKKYNDLKKRIHKELELSPSTDYNNIFTYSRFNWILHGNIKSKFI